MSIIREIKPSLAILLRFVLVYFILFAVYQLYLNITAAEGLDPYSRWAAYQVNELQKLLGYSSFTRHYPQSFTEVFYISGKAITRMVEGCNAISVMILCVSFLFAFYQGRGTWFFVVGSIVFLHFINILRIVGINIIYIEMEDWAKAAHDYLFPAVIYGSVVIIWLLWMRKINRKINKV